jgi:hypothetical protein
MRGGRRLRRGGPLGIVHVDVNRRGVRGGRRLRRGGPLGIVHVNVSRRGRRGGRRLRRGGPLGIVHVNVSRRGRRRGGWRKTLSLNQYFTRYNSSLNVSVIFLTRETHNT